MTSVVSYTSVSLMMLTRPDLRSLSTVTSAELAIFAGQAEAEMVGRLAQRYALPPTVPCPLLETLATDLAVYRVLSRRQYITRDAKEKSGIEVVYTQAIATLSLLAAGLLPLVDASGTVLTERTDRMPVLSSTEAYLPTFHEGPDGTHVKDPNKIDDLLTAREFDALRDRLT